MNTLIRPISWMDSIGCIQVAASDAALYTPVHIHYITGLAERYLFIGTYLLQRKWHTACK
jgi:hypothetical protein